MTFSNFIDKLAWFFSLLYFRHWERWELLVIVLICLVLLLLIIWQQRKSAIKSVYVNQIRERSPIIGVKLADRSHLRIEDVKHARSEPLSKKEVKQIKTKEQLSKLNKQVQQLQYEIDKHKRIEARLKSQVIMLTTELTTVNEQLRQNSVTSNQAGQKQKQQIVEVSAGKEQPPLEPAETSTPRRQAKQKAIKSKAAQKSYNRRINTLIQPGKNIQESAEQAKLPKEVREQPLDVQKLQSIAELAKKIKSGPSKSCS